MVEYKDELFIISLDEDDRLKQYTRRLLNDLPKEPKTALLTVVFLKEIMEKQLKMKVKGIKIEDELNE